MTIQLLTYDQQPLIQEKLIGVMNFDFVSGGRLSNRWIPGDLFDSYSEEYGLENLQTQINHLLFNQLGTWEQVADLVDPDKCLALFDTDDVSFYYAETEEFNFFVRLMPSDISKIFVYDK